MDTTSYSALEQRIDELEYVHRPIPVGERLPENHSSSLVWLNDLDEPQTWGWQTAYYLDGRWFRATASDLEDDVSETVTHWLPLPPAPADAKQ